MTTSDVSRQPDRQWGEGVGLAELAQRHPVGGAPVFSPLVCGDSGRSVLGVSRELMLSIIKGGPSFRQSVGHVDLGHVDLGHWSFLSWARRAARYCANAASAAGTAWKYQAFPTLALLPPINVTSWSSGPKYKRTRKTVRGSNVTRTSLMSGLCAEVCIRCLTSGSAAERPKCSRFRSDDRMPVALTT
jgi:hypothetical protein